MASDAEDDDVIHVTRRELPMMTASMTPEEVRDLFYGDEALDDTDDDEEDEDDKGKGKAESDGEDDEEESAVTFAPHGAIDPATMARLLSRSMFDPNDDPGVASFKRQRMGARSGPEETGEAALRRRERAIMEFDEAAAVDAPDDSGASSSSSSTDPEPGLAAPGTILLAGAVPGKSTLWNQSFVRSLRERLFAGDADTRAYRIMQRIRYHYANKIKSPYFPGVAAAVVSKRTLHPEKPGGEEKMQDFRAIRSVRAVQDLFPEFRNMPLALKARGPLDAEPDHAGRNIYPAFPMFYACTFWVPDTAGRPNLDLDNPEHKAHALTAAFMRDIDDPRYPEVAPGHSMVGSFMANSTEVKMYQYGPDYMTLRNRRDAAGAPIDYQNPTFARVNDRYRRSARTSMVRAVIGARMNNLIVDVAAGIADEISMDYPWLAFECSMPHYGHTLNGMYRHDWIQGRAARGVRRFGEQVPQSDMAHGGGVLVRERCNDLLAMGTPDVSIEIEPMREFRYAERSRPAPRTDSSSSAASSSSASAGTAKTEEWVTDPYAYQRADQNIDQTRHPHITIRVFIRMSWRYATLFPEEVKIGKYILKLGGVGYRTVFSFDPKHSSGLKKAGGSFAYAKRFEEAIKHYLEGSNLYNLGYDMTRYRATLVFSPYVTVGMVSPLLDKPTMYRFLMSQRQSYESHIWRLLRQYEAAQRPRPYARRKMKEIGVPGEDRGPLPPVPVPNLASVGLEITGATRKGAGATVATSDGVVALMAEPDYAEYVNNLSCAAPVTNLGEMVSGHYVVDRYSGLTGIVKLRLRGLVFAVSRGISDGLYYRDLTNRGRILQDKTEIGGLFLPTKSGGYQKSQLDDLLVTWADRLWRQCAAITGRYSHSSPRVFFCDIAEMSDNLYTAREATNPFSRERHSYTTVFDKRETYPQATTIIYDSTHRPAAFAELLGVGQVLRGEDGRRLQAQQKLRVVAYAPYLDNLSFLRNSALPAYEAAVYGEALDGSLPRGWTHYMREYHTMAAIPLVRASLSLTKRLNAMVSLVFNAALTSFERADAANERASTLVGRLLDDRGGAGMFAANAKRISAYYKRSYHEALTQARTDLKVQKQAVLDSSLKDEEKQARIAAAQETYDRRILMATGQYKSSLGLVDDLYRQAETLADEDILNSDMSANLVVVSYRPDPHDPGKVIVDFTPNPHYRTILEDRKIAGCKAEEK